MATSFKDKLVEIITNGNIIAKKDLDAALEIQKKSGGSLGRILIDRGAISSSTLAVIMAKELNLPIINISKYSVSPDIVKLIPEKIAKQYLLLPISRIENTLTVAMADPLNIFAIDDIKLVTNFNIDPVIATEDSIKEAIGKYYGAMTQESMADILKSVDATDDVEILEEEKINIDEAMKESKKAPRVKIVNIIISEALKKRASDIHLEPCEKHLRVRYRIDGNLQDVLAIPKTDQNAIMTRFKIMSSLDITETRIPQDGHFSINFEGKEIDFRVSVLPVTFGGKIVLRILDKTNLSQGLEKLGFSASPLASFNSALKRPYGMILLTGPTGSGKSTTLYAILNQLNTTERNIVTLEDPVEYALQGITQIQVRPEIGLTFAQGLKSVLRQSPDIIMVGEIRDFETADIAIKASLTGQMILSTLHTNDAAGAITRLIDMGAEPFLVGSSLILAAAQRLMRKICPACKHEVEIPKDVLEKAGVADAVVKKKEKKAFYKGKGCPKCSNTGYFGRMAILEALLIDDAIKDMIMRKASSDEIKDYGVKNGMMTLRDCALEALSNGITTLDEVINITTED